MPEDSYKTTLIEVAAEQSYNAIVITDADLAGGGPFIIYCNSAFCAMTGYERAELLGQCPRILQGPETDPDVIVSLRKALTDAVFWEGSATNYRKDDSDYIVSWNISPIFDETGAVTHFVSVQQDITSRVRVEAERDMLLQALNQAHDPIFVTDHQARIVFANNAFESLTGYQAREIIGKTPGFLASGEHDADFYRQMWERLKNNEPFQARFLNRRKDGSRYYVQQNIAPVLDKTGKHTHFISTCWHVDDLVKREKTLRDLATHDGLTGLLNRNAGETELHAAYRDYIQYGRALSVIICDIDNFKRVNDSFGHPSGDRILKSISRIISELTRASDPAVRWGGEEFLIVVQEGANVAMGLAERIRHSVERLQDDEAGTVTLSLGVAEIATGETIEQLMRRADSALYNAKRSGRNHTVVA